MSCAAVQACGRLIHDADSHLMEMTDVLDPYFEVRLLARYHDLPVYKWKHSHADRMNEERARHEDAACRAAAGDAILRRKNYEALGSFRREDRPAAMDRLGFASHLASTTFCFGNFGLDPSADMELCYAAADPSSPAAFSLLPKSLWKTSPAQRPLPGSAPKPSWFPPCVPNGVRPAMSGLMLSGALPKKLACRSSCTSAARRR